MTPKNPPPPDPVAEPEWDGFKIPGEPIPGDRLVFQFCLVDGVWEFNAGSYLSSEDRAWESDYTHLPKKLIVVDGKLRTAYDMTGPDGVPRAMVVADD